MRIGRDYAFGRFAYLIIVSHDSPLQLGCVYPSDKVFHMSGRGSEHGKRLVGRLTW